jgi:hypothetical protein
MTRVSQLHGSVEAVAALKMEYAPPAPTHASPVPFPAVPEIAERLPGELLFRKVVLVAQLCPLGDPMLDDVIAFVVKKSSL